MRTERVDINQARDQLADLIAFVSDGGEVILVQDGIPVARLISATDRVVEKANSSNHAQFASDENLTWDAEGWEEIT